MKDFRGWIVAILVVALLSAGTTLLLGAVFRGELAGEAPRSGCGGSCCGDAGK